MTDEEIIQMIRDRAAGSQLPAPATPEMLVRAEEELGFKLPALLRRLYAEVADGGFGPGGSVLPLFSPELPQRRHEAPGLVDLYRHLRQADLERELNWIEGDPDPDEDYDLSWPALMLPFCSWAVVAGICVDCSNAQAAVKYYDGGSSKRFAEWSPSLRRWLEEWVGGKWDPMFGPRRRPTGARAAQQRTAPPALSSAPAAPTKPNSSGLGPVGDF